MNNDEPTCNRCGLCCESIGFDLKKERPRMKKLPPPLDGDVGFILEHWHVRKGQTVCDRFDRRSKLCRVQETKPHVCSGFPLYGGPIAHTYLPDECSYRFLMELPES
jgi:Fe-S-cluster containining protein